MSEGNPNHDPATGQFSSGGGSSGPKSKVGKTPRKLRTAKRSTTPAERRQAMGVVDVTKIKTPEEMQANREQRRLAITGQATQDEAAKNQAGVRQTAKPASPSADDLQRLINPGYGVKSYAPIPGGLKDPKPIDPAHVPPATSGRAARTARRKSPLYASPKYLGQMANAEEARTKKK